MKYIVDIQKSIKTVEDVNEFLNWLEKNIKPRFFSRRLSYEINMVINGHDISEQIVYHVGFLRELDAVAFKLRWL